MSKLIYATALGVVGIVLVTFSLAAGYDLAKILTEDTRELVLTKRAVDHVYGTSVAIETPNGKSVYFRWCDPEGYMLFANGFDSNSPVTAVWDKRCKAIR